VCSVLPLLAFFLVCSGAFAGGNALFYSTNPQYPPYDWADGPSSFAGASVELLSLVLPPGVVATPVVLPWKRALEQAREGQIDLLLSVRITPERSEYLRFTAHRAFPNPIVVFARRESRLSLRSWEGLQGHPGGVSAGDFFGGGFDQYWHDHLQVEIADTMVENFRKLEAGRIDWFVTGRYLGQAYLSVHPLDREIVVLEPPVSTGDIHFAFSAKSPWVKLIPSIDARLEELDRQGVLDYLIRKYQFGSKAAQPGHFPGEVQ